MFGFDDGPPLHDALTIAYVSNPATFQGSRLHVDVETRGEHTTGATIVDTWSYRTYDNTLGAQRKKLQCVGVARGLSLITGSSCY
jgi:uridine nucleosidase